MSPSLSSESRSLEAIVIAGLVVVIGFGILHSNAYAASLTYNSPATISIASPATTLTIASGSVAEGLQVNATSVLVTLSNATGGSFTITSPTLGLSVATSSGGGAVASSCTGGTASVILSQATGSTVYTITPASTQCLSISSVVASTTVTTATITWTTDNSASSEVDYGPTTSYSSIVSSSTLATYHAIALSNLTPGAQYHFQVKSVDAQGNVAFSPDQIFNAVTDIIPPTVSMTAPAGGSTLSGMVTLSANASDNMAVASVQFMVDGTNIGAAITVPPYQTSWDTTGAQNGSHVLTALALDTSGNTASSTITVTVANVAATAPGVIVAGGGSGSTYDISINNGMATTTASSVMLSLYGSGAYTMELSNNSNFANSTWIPYVTSMPWTLLASTTGEQTVYVQFRSVSGSVVGSAQASTDFVPTTATSISLTAEIEFLRAELAVLLKQTGLSASASTPAPTQATSAHFTFTRNLSLGMTSGDVTQLQKFLAKNPSIYPNGQTTGYFGALTKRAVQQFQKKYGLAKAGQSVYGYVGPATRAKLNALIKEGLAP